MRFLSRMPLIFLLCLGLLGWGCSDGSVSNEAQVPTTTGEETQGEETQDNPVVPTPTPSSESEIISEVIGDTTPGLTDTSSLQPPADLDLDGVIDEKDDCPSVYNPKQDDLDKDGLGDVCDDDMDGDDVLNTIDNCLRVPNTQQQDQDGDNVGDACDKDYDNDGIMDDKDNCPHAYNPAQEDADKDGEGDACDTDDDDDGILDVNDNCHLVKNIDQKDMDNDGEGDVCDEDRDGDKIKNSADNCPDAANFDQLDSDNDGKGDVCDEDDDADGILDVNDNCCTVANAGQADQDSDDIGDTCDPDIDGDGSDNSVDPCPYLGNVTDKRLCDGKIDGVLDTLINAPVISQDVSTDYSAAYQYAHINNSVTIEVIGDTLYLGEQYGIRKVELDSAGDVLSTQKVYNYIPKGNTQTKRIEYVKAIARVPSAVGGKYYFIILDDRGNLSPKEFALYRVEIENLDAGPQPPWLRIQLVAGANLPLQSAFKEAMAAAQNSNQFNMGIFKRTDDKFVVYVSSVRNVPKDVKNNFYALTLSKNLENIEEIQKIFTIQGDTGSSGAFPLGGTLHYPRATLVAYHEVNNVKKPFLYLSDTNKIYRGETNASTGIFISQPEAIALSPSMTATYGLTKMDTFPEHVFISAPGSDAANKSTAYKIFALKNGETKPLPLTGSKSIHASGHYYGYAGYYNFNGQATSTPAPIGLYLPYGMSSRGNELFVVDRNNRSVRKFSINNLSGNPAISSSSIVVGNQPILGQDPIKFEPEEGEFYKQSGIAVSPDGKYIFGMDEINRVLTKFSINPHTPGNILSGGEFVMQFKEQGLYTHLLDMAEVTHNGKKEWRMYVADTSKNNKHRLYLIKFDPTTGNVIEQIAALPILSDLPEPFKLYNYQVMRVTEDGKFVYVSAYKSGSERSVFKFKLSDDGKTVVEKGALTLGASALPYSIEHFVEGGKTYLAIYDYGNKKISRVELDSNGNPLVITEIAGGGTTVPPLAPDVPGALVVVPATPFNYSLGPVTELRYVGGTLWIGNYSPPKPRLLRIDSFMGESPKVYMMMETKAEIIADGVMKRNQDGTYPALGGFVEPIFDVWKYKGTIGFIISDKGKNAIRVIR